MKILFDQGTPVPLRRAFQDHEVSTAYELGWQELTNGDLLSRAEIEFDLLITTDQSLQYQQNRTGRQLAILVLTTTSWPRIAPDVERIVAAALAVPLGELHTVELG